MKVLLSAVAVAITGIATWAVIVVTTTPAASEAPVNAPAASMHPIASSASPLAANLAHWRQQPKRTAVDHAGLQQQVDRLLQRGNARDRYQAFTLLARCADAMDFDRYLTSLPSSVETMRLRERYGDGSVRVEAACGDLLPRQVEQRIELAAVAADDGVPGAATAWLEQGPYGDRSALTQRPDDPLVVAWVEQAIGRVLAATRHSDIEAISQFGSLCLNWEMDDVSRVRLLVDGALERRREDQLKSMLN